MAHVFLDAGSPDNRLDQQCQTHIHIRVFMHVCTPVYTRTYTSTQGDSFDVSIQLDGDFIPLSQSAVHVMKLVEFHVPVLTESEGPLTLRATKPGHPSWELKVKLVAASRAKCAPLPQVCVHVCVCACVHTFTHTCSHKRKCR